MKRDDYRISFAAIRRIDKEPSNLYWHVVDHISFMPWPDSDSELQKALEIAPEGVRRFYLAGTIQGPVENGGFGQYFASQRSRWLHDMAKETISQFGCPQVVEIVNEAERYVESNRERLRDGMELSEWNKVMGVVAMNKATNNINRRFLKACEALNEAEANYVKKYPKRFE